MNGLRTRDDSVEIVDENFNPALQQLLDDELTTDPTTMRGLTNHLPMALVAKERLGADADELRRFASLYSRRITALDEPIDPSGGDDMASAIGERAAAADLRDYFVRRVKDEGADEVLRSHCPRYFRGSVGRPSTASYDSRTPSRSRRRHGSRPGSRTWPKSAVH